MGEEASWDKKKFHIPPRLVVIRRNIPLFALLSLECVIGEIGELCAMVLADLSVSTAAAK